LANLLVRELSNLVTNGAKLTFLKRGGRSGGTGLSVCFQRRALSNRPKMPRSAPKQEMDIV
jgi:hypothetical protein